MDEYYKCMGEGFMEEHKQKGLLDKDIFVKHVNEFLKHFTSKWDKERFILLYKEMSQLNEYQLKFILREVKIRFNQDQLPTVYDIKHVAFQVCPTEINLRLGATDNEIFNRRVEKKLAKITTLDPFYHEAKINRKRSDEEFRKKEEEFRKKLHRPRVVPEGGF